MILIFFRKSANITNISRAILASSRAIDVTRTSVNTVKSFPNTNVFAGSIARVTVAQALEKIITTAC